MMPLLAALMFFMIATSCEKNCKCGMSFYTCVEAAKDHSFSGDRKLAINRCIEIYADKIKKSDGIDG